VSASFIGVHGDDGKIIFVLVDSRADFDKIGAKATDHRTLEKNPRQLLTKVIEGKSGEMVIFQHWLESAKP